MDVYCQKRQRADMASEPLQTERELFPFILGITNSTRDISHSSTEDVIWLSRMSLRSPYQLTNGLLGSTYLSTSR